MKPKLLYVELKTGFNDDGPAWIGYGSFSKTGKTVYFNGQAFTGHHGGGIHFDISSGDEYWISGIKKNGGNRHWAGKGKIIIDKDVVSEYLSIINQDKLPNSKYDIIELDKSIPKEAVYQYLNRKI
jgi:hypothetical protein